MSLNETNSEDIYDNAYTKEQLKKEIIKKYIFQKN